MLIRNFMAYLPRMGGERDGAGENPEAARALRWAAGKGRPTLDSGYVLAVEGFSGEGGREPPTTPGARIFLQVLPGAAASHVAGETEALPLSVEAWEAWAERRVDLFNLIRTGPRDLLVMSDILGLLPYWVGDLEEGVVVSSSIHDLLSAFPELARPFDPLGLTNVLIEGRGTRTVHARIRASAAGATLHWTERDGLVTRRDRRLGPVTLEADLGARDAVHQVVDLLGEKISSFVEGSEECVLPLTGGFDSRLMACVVKERGIPCQTVTLGHRFHTEVKVARRIAKILDLPHTLLEPRGDLENPVPRWLEAQGGQSGYGTLYIMELLDRGYAEGAPILHGLLAGNLAYGGAFFDAAGFENTPESIARFLVSFLVADLQPDFPEILGLAVGPEALLDEMRPTIVPADSSLHSMLIWDLEYRQPRGVGAQLTFLGQEYRAGAPFYDRRQISAWMAIPRMGHEDRRLLRWIFLEKYPEVASIPHCEEQPYRLPNSPSSARHLAGLLGMRARDGVLRRVLPGHDKRAGRRYVWGLWHTLSPRQAAHQREVLEEKWGRIGDVLGWQPPDRGGEPLWDRMAAHPRRAGRIRRSFYLLTEYCDWLKRTIPGI